MQTILLVDDDNELLDALGILFEMNGYRVLRASNGKEALAACVTSKPAILISDVNMPVMDGFTLCRELRQLSMATPLILLTTRDTDIDEALGLDLGADDYISKPVSNRVLLARVKVLLRRTMAPAPTNQDVVIDHERLSVHYRGRPVQVTVTEIELLHALMRRPGIVKSRSALIDELRGGEVVVGERLIDTYVRRLRRKLEEIDPSFDLLETVVGAGYKWKT